MNIEKVYQMEFGKIYPLLVNKATKKGRGQYSDYLANRI